MGQEYIYYAFVSYSHKDKEWAEWIWDAIEHYRLPAVIRKEVQKPLPKKMRPVFLDKADLGVGVLEESIRDELVASRYLVVICSPNSARPNGQGEHFVDKEVRHFLEMGRKEKIIPVLVEGTPEESFCPKIREAGLKAIDAIELPRARVLNDVVAKILGLKPDVLWRRAERERKKRLIIKSALGGFLGLLTAFVGYFAWDANRAVVNYYADYVDSFGLPEGIFPLTKEEIKGRHVHYRFEYRGYGLGKSVHHDSSDWNIFKPLGFYRVLRRVVQANSAGIPKKLTEEEFVDHPAMQDFTYEQDGLNLGKRLKQIRHGRFGGQNRTPYFENRIEFYNHNGITNGLVRFLNNSDNQFDFLNAAAILPFDTDLLNPKRYSAIIQKKLQRDSKGRVKQCLFLNAKGGTESDGDGVNGYAYELDDVGREVLQRYLIGGGCEVENKYQANRIGISGKRRRFDGKRLLKVEFLDATDKLAMNHNGWMACEFGEFDKYDNPGCVRYIDENGRLMFTKEGYAKIRMFYDECGNVERKLFYDVDGSATNCKDGVAGWKWEHDSLGRRTGRCGIDENGHGVVGKNGVVGTRFFYDDHGNMTNESYYGESGIPKLCSQWYAGLCHQYDPKGRKVFSVCYGTDGFWILSREGYAIVGYEYYDDGKIKSATYYGADGRPVLNKSGFCRISIDKYDENGNVQVISLRDTHNNLVSGMGSVAKIFAKYNEHGQMEHVSLFGASGEKVLCNKEFAEAGFTYDERGRVVKISCYGTDGKLKLCFDGYAERTVVEHDMRGNDSKVFLSGADGKAVLSMPCIVHMVFDKYGRIAKNRWFGERNTRMLDEDGVFETCCYRDQYGNVTNETYFGLNGEKKKCKEGYAEWSGIYDKNGRLEQRSFYDEHGRSVECTDGYAKVRYWYDSLGDGDQVDYFDLAGRRKSNRRIIAVRDVHAGSLAADMGVQVGDIVCHLNVDDWQFSSTTCNPLFCAQAMDLHVNEPYDIMSTREVREFRSLLHGGQNRGKELVIARRNGDAYEIFSYSFPNGQMGFCVAYGDIRDYVELEASYKVYCENGKGEKK